MKQRESWLDYLRAFGCILVTVGHLLMSFQKEEIVQSGVAVTTFISLIYCFHVYIFFFCSGYLFQAKQNNTTNSSLYRIEKCVNFLVLYVIFTTVTYLMKIIFSSSVNSAIENNLFDTLLKYPINQMWYLYAISVVFLFAHVIRSDKSAYILLLVALLFKIVSISGLNSFIPIPIAYLFQNLLWFVIGQMFSYKQIRLSIRTSLLAALLFVVLFACKTLFEFNAEVVDAILTFLGVIASAGMVYNLTKNKSKAVGLWKYLSKYMLQIYLLHTIFAAGIRAVLLKIGISHACPHIILGLVFSFVPPVVCAIIAERMRMLNFFFFPIKTVKEFLASKKQRNLIDT